MRNNCHHSRVANTRMMTIIAHNILFRLNPPIKNGIIILLYVANKSTAYRVPKKANHLTFYH